MNQRNRLDKEIQVIPAEYDPTIIYIRLSYTWREETGVDQAQWQPHLLPFDRAQSYKTVLNIIEKYVNAKLKEFAPELCARLDKSKSCIILQLIFQSADKVKQYACRLDASGTQRLHTLSDLYGNREECRPELNFNVERRREEPRDEDGPRKRVRIRTSDDCLPSSEYFLLGSLPITLDEENSTPSSTVPRDLQYTKTVDRYFCKYGPDCVPTPVIVRVPAWRPLDLDSEKLQKTKHKIPADFEASELCRELLSANSYQFFGDLLKGLQQQIDNTSKPHDFGSCQPKYRFCTVSDVFWSVSGFPRSTQDLVPVVVRLFQHLEPETEMESVFDDFQFSANDKFAKIHETIMEALKDDEEPMALLTRHHARGESCNVEL